MMPSEQDRANEESVLGGMMSDATAISEAIAILCVDDFYFQHHRDIFTAISEVWMGANPAEGIDLRLVYDALRKAGKIEDPGRDAARLYGLTELDPTGANVTHRARLVKEFSLRKQLHQLGSHITAEAEHPSCSADDLLGDAQKRVFQIGSGNQLKTVHIAEGCQHFQVFVAERMANQQDGVTGVPSGLLDLDSITSGFQAGELTLIAARPSVGKSALAMQVAENAAVAGTGVLFFSLEMSLMELIARFASGEARINTQQIRKGRLNQDQVIRLGDACDQLSKLPLWINDSSSQKARHIYADARRMKQSKDIGLVVIDYMQLIDPEDHRENRNEQIAVISRTLKKMARELGIPVICLSQLNREADKRGSEPKLSDLRDSGALEQDADVAMLMSRVGEQDDMQPVEKIKVRIAKQRNGPTGSCVLVFRKETTRFENCAFGDVLDA